MKSPKRPFVEGTDAPGAFGLVPADVPAGISSRFRLVRRVCGAGVASGGKAVEDFSAMAAREREGRATGL